MSTHPVKPVKAKPTVKPVAKPVVPGFEDGPPVVRAKKGMRSAEIKALISSYGNALHDRKVLNSLKDKMNKEWSTVEETIKNKLGALLIKKHDKASQKQCIALVAKESDYALFMNLAKVKRISVDTALEDAILAKIEKMSGSDWLKLDNMSASMKTKCTKDKNGFLLFLIQQITKFVANMCKKKTLSIDIVNRDGLPKHVKLVEAPTGKTTHKNLLKLFGIHYKRKNTLRTVNKYITNLETFCKNQHDVIIKIMKARKETTWEYKKVNRVLTPDFLSVVDLLDPMYRKKPVEQTVSVEIVLKNTNMTAEEREHRVNAPLKEVKIPFVQKQMRTIIMDNVTMMDPDKYWTVDDIKTVPPATISMFVQTAFGKIRADRDKQRRDKKRKATDVSIISRAKLPRTNATK